MLGNRYEVLLVSYYFPTFIDCEATNKVEIRDLVTDTKLTCAYDSWCGESVLFQECRGVSQLYFTMDEEYSSDTFLFDFESNSVTSDAHLEGCNDFHEFENVKWDYGWSINDWLWAGLSGF